MEKTQTVAGNTYMQENQMFSNGCVQIDRCIIRLVCSFACGTCKHGCNTQYTTSEVRKWVSRIREVHM